MLPLRVKAGRDDGPEAKIQNRLIDRLKAYDWMVEVMHGNLYQYGIPDLYAAHTKWGTRWIEVKNPLKFSFTPAQIEKFPKFVAFGVGIWILFDSTDEEIGKLFKPCNWFEVYNRWIHSAL